VQLIAEKEILIVVSLVRCFAIRKNIIVASQFYEVADIQFAVRASIAVFSTQICFFLVPLGVYA